MIAERNRGLGKLYVCKGSRIWNSQTNIQIGEVQDKWGWGILALQWPHTFPDADKLVPRLRQWLMTMEYELLVEVLEIMESLQLRNDE